MNDAQLGELMKLLKGADTTELKVSIPQGNHFATIRGLPIDPVEAQPRQVFFFDTPDLALNKAGVVVRARRIAGGRGDTVVKLRPIVPETLPEELRKSGALGVEVDVIPGGFVCSASMKGRATGDEIRGGRGRRRPCGSSSPATSVTSTRSGRRPGSPSIRSCRSARRSSSRAPSPRPR